MTPRATSRGGPLIALCAILGLWIVARAVLVRYDMPSGSAELQLPPPPIAIAETVPPFSHDELPEHLAAAAIPYAFTPPPSQRITPVPLRWDRGAVPAKPFLPHSRGSRREMLAPVGMAAGHHVLWMAALANLPLPAGIAAMRQAAPNPVPFYPAVGVANRADQRWSADGWLLLRPGGSTALETGGAPATYGASQLGAVVRYRIAPHSAHRPNAYLRAAAALQGAAEKEVAVGISVRPVAALPLRALVELRASDQPMGQQLRPAALVVTEVQPINLPQGSRIEFYGQAGYVGGKFATAFADGQVRGDTKIAELGNGALRAGAGAWAGAQKGAARVDIGPTAMLDVPIGQSVSARLGLDWRMRVAGNAEPGAGPALTLSAGF